MIEKSRLESESKQETMNFTPLNTRLLQVNRDSKCTASWDLLKYELNDKLVMQKRAAFLRSQGSVVKVLRSNNGLITLISVLIIVSKILWKISLQYTETNLKLPGKLSGLAHSDSSLSHYPRFP